MKPKKPGQKTHELRKRAEEKLKAKITSPKVMSDKETRQLIHELQVHQIELEMQNDELRKAQSELEESRAGYSNLYDFAPVGYFTFDKHGLILEANLTAATQLGVERSLLVNKPFRSYIVTEDGKLFDSDLLEVFKSSARQTCEIRMKRKYDGGFYTQLESISVNDLKGNALCRTSVSDITKRRQSEEIILESKRVNDLLLDSYPYPAMLIRQDRIILAANRIAREMGAEAGKYCWQEFGRSQFISEKDKRYIEEHPDRIQPAGIKCCFCLAEEALSSGMHKHSEVNAFGRIWDTRWTPIRDDIFLHYAIDITEYKKAEEELKQLADELKRSNVDLEQFAYAASHDLQEPLRVVAGFVQLLEKRYKNKLDDKANEFIDYAVDGVKRMQILIKDLLEYSQVGTKGGPFKTTNCSVALEQAIYNLYTTIEESGTELTYDLLPTLLADAAQISRLFQNLIGNAIKFHGERRPEIRISAEQRGDEWIFSVRDNGIGINPKHAGRIFEVFQRLHTRKEYEGTGIGLAICKRIVERHGGRIWVESKPGKGATFFFTVFDRK